MSNILVKRIETEMSHVTLVLFFGNLNCWATSAVVRGFFTIWPFSELFRSEVSEIWVFFLPPTLLCRAVGSGSRGWGGSPSFGALQSRGEERKR